MAYSDYGGYAYRNKERHEDRSDCVLTRGAVKSTPGMWPGWTLPEAREDAICYHALLGDGPIFVGLRKQSTVDVYRLGTRLNALDLLVDPVPESVNEYSDGRYINDDYYKDNDLPYVLSVDGYEIFVRPVITDNHYVFVRLTQPDGVIWHGFSGYGVGAGLEGCGYGYDTDAVADEMWAALT